MLAIAGSLARKKHVPESAGTLPTHTPLFVFFLVGIVIFVGALTFFPALRERPALYRQYVEVEMPAAWETAYVESYGIMLLIPRN